MQLFFPEKRSLLRSNHHRHILTHQGYYLAVVGVFSAYSANCLRTSS